MTIADERQNEKGKTIKKQTYLLSNEEFIAELKSMNGTPKKVLENEELMAFLLPTLSADFKIADQYSCINNIRLPCHGSIISGKDDPIEEEYINDWQAFFTQSKRYELEGDHFFINSHQADVIEIVNKQLSSIIYKI